MQRASLSVLLAMLAGCYGPPTLEHVVVARDSTGELSLIARHRTGSGEAGDYEKQSLGYAEQRDGAWRSETLDLETESPAHWGETYYELLRGPDDRMTIVVNPRSGTIVLQQDLDGSWTRTPVAADLPAEAQALLAEPDELGGAWFGSDGELRLLVGEFLLETAGGSIARAIPTGDSCQRESPFDSTDAPIGSILRIDCHFAPTGDRGGDGAIFEVTVGSGEDHLRLQRLQCVGDVCSWSDVPDHGLGGPGSYDSGWENKIFFHTSDGTPTLVQPSGFFDLRAGGGGNSLLVGGEFFRFGAAPRAAGGFVIVTEAYRTDELMITVVDATYAAQRFPLPTIPLIGSRPLAVTVAPALPGEAEHAELLLPMSASSIAHLTVDLATGEVQREDIVL